MRRKVINFPVCFSTEIASLRDAVVNLFYNYTYLTAADAAVLNPSPSGPPYGVPCGYSLYEREKTTLIEQFPLPVDGEEKILGQGNVYRAKAKINVIMPAKAAQTRRTAAAKDGMTVSSIEKNTAPADMSYALAVSFIRKTT